MSKSVASRKWNLPDDVKKLDVSKLSLAHMKVMLEYMGIALHNQSGGKSGRMGPLQHLIASEPAKAQLAYDFIVHNKVPAADQKILDNSEAMRAHFYGVMTKLLGSEQLDQLKTSMDAHVESRAKKIEEGLASAAKRALEKASENYRPIVVQDGKKRTVVKGVLPREFETIVQLCTQRVPTMLVGPAGCGKTFIAGKVAEALDLEFYDQSCSEGVSESIFTGWLLPTTSGGAFNYVSSPYITAYESGGVFLLDEMDAADPNLLTFLNKSIANESFFLPQRYKNPLVKKHPDFVVIGAANTFGHGANAQYVGRNALDAATLDRFRAGMIHMDYSAEVEVALVDESVLTWGRAVRTCIYKHQLRRIMSTRVMLDLTRMTRAYKWGQHEWERAYFADWSKEEHQKWTTERPKDLAKDELPPMCTCRAADDEVDDDCPIHGFGIETQREEVHSRAKSRILRDFS